MAVSDHLDRLRQPEYIGENRCMPCTIVNVVISTGLAVLVGIGGFLAGIESLIAGGLGVAILVVGLAAIYLRGYLVPGTPTLTKRYFPDRILRYFDKADSQQPAGGDIDPESLLKSAAVVEECEHDDDLCLTDSFRSAWYTQIEERRSSDSSREDLAALLDFDPDDLEFKEYDAAFVARLDGRRIGQWESDGAFVADMAAAAALNDRIDTWEHIDIYERSNLLKGLRAFLDSCPICDGTISMNEEVVESCCRSIDVVAINCEFCDRRIFEAEHPG